jgi:hypothetical protein
VWVGFGLSNRVGVGCSKYHCTSLLHLPANLYGSCFLESYPGLADHCLCLALSFQHSREPKKRPTCAQILNSPEAEPWLNTIPESVRQPLPPLVGPADTREWRGW